MVRMNAMKGSIGQLKYRHIFKLMFSCCFLSELGAMFVYVVAITDGN